MALLRLGPERHAAYITLVGLWRVAVGVLDSRLHTRPWGEHLEWPPSGLPSHNGLAYPRYTPMAGWAVGL